jgi:hypothetical protein
MKGACSWIGSDFLWRGGRGAIACSWTHAAVAAGLWEEEGSPFLSPYIYSPYKCDEVFGGYSTLSLSLF